MATNLELDNALILEAMKWGKHKSKRAAVNAALEYYIRLRTPSLPDKVAVKKQIDERAKANRDRPRIDKK